MATKALRDAQARVKASQSVLASYDAETARLLAAAQKARAKLDRMGGPGTFARKGHPPSLIDTSEVRIERGFADGDRDKPRATLIEEVMAGGRKVRIDGTWQSRALKAVVGGLREWRAVDVAHLRRLDKRIAQLEAEREALIVTAHEAGQPWDPGLLASHAVTVDELSKAAAELRGGYGSRFGPEDWRRRSLESNLTDAQIHLRFVSGEMDPEADPVCPCRECIRTRTELEASRKEAARLAALPKVTLRDCPCGKTHRVPLDRGRGDYAGDHWDDLPVVTCPTTKTRYVYTPVADKEKAARDKAAAKELREHGIEWTCPTCGESRTTLVEREYFNGDPNYLYVSCDVCEQSHGVNDVTITKYRNRIAAMRKEAA